MKQVYIIGFRGVGIHTEYQHENGLILLGHVGLAFEGHEKRILGFHPTPESMKGFSDTQTALRWLRDRHTLDGSLQDDTTVFCRAYALTQRHTRLKIWQYTISLADDLFNQTHQQALKWYREQTLFPYGLPTQQQTWDNCATFPQRLGLPLPEPTGHLLLYVKQLQSQETPWLPKEDTC